MRWCRRPPVESRRARVGSVAGERDFDERRTAMLTRNIVGHAQSILMKRFEVTAEQAFAVLARASQDTNVKLRDVAQRLIDTGESPGR